SSPADAPSTRRRQLQAAMSRRFSRSSRRVSFGIQPTATGCSRRSASMRWSTLQHPEKRGGFAVRTPSGWSERPECRGSATRPERHDLVLPERENIYAALEWAAEQDPLLGMRIVVALEQFWVAAAPFEGRRWIGEFLESPELPTALRARALRCYGGLHWIVGD